MLKRTSLALAITLAAAVTAATAQTIQVNHGNRTIEVTASATVSEMANVAVLHIGYQVYGPTSKAAYAKASESSNAIADALKQAGVPKDQIHSQDQLASENPNWDDTTLTVEQRAQQRYLAKQTWTVKLPAKDAARILNLAVEAGANNSGGIDWKLADSNTLQAEAAAKALAHCRQIAAAMAKGLGVTLGPLLYANNQYAQVWHRPMNYVMSAFGNGQGVAPKPLSISPQRISQTASIHAIFSIQ